ncbi:FlaA1/EpsC-like NDP-sugar epimerase [Gammaproteobacteria bacterium]
MVKKIFRSSTVTRRGFLFFLDQTMVAFSTWMAFSLRFGETSFGIEREHALLFLINGVLAGLIFSWMGFYRSLIRYSGSEMVYTVLLGATFVESLSLPLWTFVIVSPKILHSVWVNLWFSLVLFVGGSRLILRDLLRSWLLARRAAPVVIYGAGSAGVQLAGALTHSPEYLPIAFVDDNPDLHGSRISGLPVRPVPRLKQIVNQYHVEAVLLAIPSASQSRRRQILESLSDLSVRVLAIPGVPELASGEKQVDELRELDIEDILGRDPVQPDLNLLHACVQGKAVMVTGAGGSIGSELCCQILALGPSHLVLFEVSEYALYAIDQKLKNLQEKMGNNAPVIIAILGSVLNSSRLQMVLKTFKIQTVYHAAAYKHVPIVEQNVVEGIQNNVFGTLKTANAARVAGVETFVLISTDKAVRPTNVMGATKRLAELILQSLANEVGNTRFCMVRFGNVLASSGSVVPLFKEQIRRGGPVTVTHPEVIRYFMTIPEAAQLVIQAGALGQGGDVFFVRHGSSRLYSRIGASHDLSLRTQSTR